MANSIRWIVRKWQWAKENPYFWLNLVLILVTACLTCLWPGPTIDGVQSDLRIRLWGGFLQLLGAYTVWRDLVGTESMFSKGTFLSRTAHWLKRGLLGNYTVTGFAASVMQSTTARAHGRVRWTVDATKSLESRVSSLEANVSYIDDELTGIQKEMQSLENSLTHKIQSETITREEWQRSTEAKIAEAFSGNTAPLACGAFGSPSVSLFRPYLMK